MTVEQALIAGRYVLRRSVGSGGMGRVWLARDELLHRDVAIKEVVPPKWLTEAERGELRELTLREARAAARLNHANVVKIYDVVHTEQWPWIVMEYVQSRSLQAVLEEEGPLAPERVAGIGLAVLDALRSAHAAGVLHRDVKPHNVLIGTDGRVVLTDFGLASLDTDNAVSRPGLIATPQYLAPERARRGVSTPDADMWSLGATLYAAVEGRTPYGRKTVVETLTALATEPPNPVTRAGALKPVIEGLLRRDPRQRMAPAEVERILKSVAAGSSPAAGAIRRHRRLIVMTTAVAAILVSTAAVAANHLGSTGTPSTSNSPAAVTVPLGVLGCEQPATITELVTKTSMAGAPGNWMPPRDWTWYAGPTGFWIAVPVGWKHWSDGSTQCFSDPRGGRVLAVDPAGPPKQDPGMAARDEERRLLGTGRLPAYESVGVKRLTYGPPSVLWEFTFGSAERRRHADALVVVHPVNTFVVYWATDELDFQPSTSLFDLVHVSFRPPPPPAGAPQPDGQGNPPPQQG
ncbi:serine/threonine-protein kinase [Hamadaea tsunoensis]|uniref:serine/threonine-protein kinase n=1 Tax=Hamadaea tsunoensis TaxID=53368 RepID=UPI0004199E39|nr:serine/threonine-protein kinase [Hamadaea tsunoensis]